jgi:hypothetical protein
METHHTHHAHVRPLALPVHVNTQPRTAKLRPRKLFSLYNTQLNSQARQNKHLSYTKQALHGNRRNQPHFPPSTPDRPTPLESRTTVQAFL